MEIDIKTIDLISEYIKTPDNVIYKDYLYKQISLTKNGLDYLNAQESVLLNLNNLKNAQIPFISNKVFPSIKKDLLKISKTKILLNHFHGIKVGLSFAVMGITAILINSINFNQKVENKIIDKSFTLSQSVEKNNNVKANSDALDKMYVKYRESSNLSRDIVMFDDDKSKLYQNKNVTGYSGDIQKYKSIDQIDSSLDKTILAEKEISSMVVDLSKIDSDLYKTLLSQHDVDLITDDN